MCVVTVEEAVDVTVDDIEVVPLEDTVVVPDAERVDDAVDVGDVAGEVVNDDEAVLVCVVVGDVRWQATNSLASKAVSAVFNSATIDLHEALLMKTVASSKQPNWADGTGKKDQPARAFSSNFRIRPHTLSPDAFMNSLPVYS